MADWEEHNAECELLRAGQAHTVERLRKTHDNGWWFNHGLLGASLGL